MKKKDEIADPNSCWNKAKDDEMVDKPISLYPLTFEQAVDALLKVKPKKKKGRKKNHSQRK